MNQRDLRIGDAERDTAARELGEHFAQGRIDSEEYAERLDQVMNAKTAGELVPAFADLPRSGASATGRGAGPVGASTGARRLPRLPELPRMPFLFKVLVAFVLVALVFSHLPLVVIALVVYVLAIRRVGRRRRRSGSAQGWHGRGYAHWR